MANQENAWVSWDTLRPSGACRESGPRLLQNQPEPCIPATLSGTFSSTTPIPASCLPIPEDATIDCRSLTAAGCITGPPEVAGPSLIEVPVTIPVAPNTVIIRDSAGNIICSIDVAQPGPVTGIVVPVTCPDTTNVTCTCTATLGPCISCVFNADRTATVCTQAFSVTVNCASSPTPTEIDCILVDKVYDFCFEEDTGLQNCIGIPATCPTPPAGSTASCTITSVQCTTGSPVPTGVDGLATVRVTITAGYNVVIRSAAGTVICTIPNQVFTFSKTVTVCGPAGTTADCEVRAATCGPCVILPPTEAFPRGQVCCEFNFCVLVETTAPVKLLVPTFGFCVPARCQTGGFPPGVCPPSPLFPPQCLPL